MQSELLLLFLKFPCQLASVLTVITFLSQTDTPKNTSGGKRQFPPFPRTRIVVGRVDGIRGFETERKAVITRSRGGGRGVVDLQREPL